MDTQFRRQVKPTASTSCACLPNDMREHEHPDDGALDNHSVTLLAAGPCKWATFEGQHEPVRSIS